MGDQIQQYSYLMAYLISLISTDEGMVPTMNLNQAVGKPQYISLCQMERVKLFKYAKKTFLDTHRITKRTVETRCV